MTALLCTRIVELFSSASRTKRRIDISEENQCRGKHCFRLTHSLSMELAKAGILFCNICKKLVGSKTYCCAQRCKFMCRTCESTMNVTSAYTHIREIQCRRGVSCHYS